MWQVTNVITSLWCYNKSDVTSLVISLLYDKKSLVWKQIWCDNNSLMLQVSGVTISLWCSKVSGVTTSLWCYHSLCFNNKSDVTIHLLWQQVWCDKSLFWQVVWCDDKSLFWQVVSDVTTSLWVLVWHVSDMSISLWSDNKSDVITIL